MSRRLAFPDRVTPHKWSQSKASGKKKKKSFSDRCVSKIVRPSCQQIHNTRKKKKKVRSLGRGEENKRERELRRTLTKCKTGIL